MASSIYYSTLAQDMLARAKNATSAVEASRLKRTAEEYFILADAVLEVPSKHTPSYSTNKAVNLCE
jgi:hypothetical protein